MSLYITQRISVVATSVFTIVALSLFKLVPIDAALSGFSSQATIAIGAMFVLSTALIKTGALEPLTAQLARWSDGKYWRLVVAMALIIPLASAFTNNTPVVVMMVPVIMSLGRQFDIAPSKLLMPLSYFAILGGTCTLIGTSTNLIIDEIYRKQTGEHLKIFDFTPLGLVVLVGGVALILIAGQRLLPHRESLSSILPKSKRSKYVTEVIVQEGSPLINKTIALAFPKKGSMRFVQLIRGEVFFTPTNMEMIIEVGDALILEGAPQELNDLLTEYSVALGTVLEDNLRVPMRTFSLTMFELVILPDSPYVGSKVKELTFNKRYGVKVLAIQRGGRHHRAAIRELRLKAGDMLLVQGDDQSISALKEAHDLLVIEDVAETIPKRIKAPMAIGIMISVVLLTTLTDIPLVVWSLLGVMLLVTTQCLRTSEAIGALDFNVLFLLIGTIPLGAALTSTGLTDDLGELLMTTVGHRPVLMISAIYLVTNVLTALVSNTATAVLMAPLAIGIAQTLGVEAKPFVMAVAFAASASFATPMGYQTNIIVMGPAGYKFSDYLRLGIPLSILIWVLASIAIPLIWPLN